MRKTYYILIMCLAVCASTVLLGCSDDPGVENYYTSTKEYASDYLANREGTFSKFIEILNKAKGEKGKYRLMDLLGTYGSFTVFAPTNEAVDEYLKEKGVPDVAHLDSADCDTIALNHIIEQGYFTTDYNNGTYPLPNMLERNLTITCDSDTISVPGEVRLAMYINKSAKIIQADDSVKNGVVHVVNHIIGTHNSMLPDILQKDSTISLFYLAMEATQYTNILRKAYMDLEYERNKSATFDRDSVDWTNDKLCLATAVEYDNVAYMKHRYFKFSAFVEPNSVYEEKYGITTLDGLRALAHQLYDPMYPDDANIEDETDPHNALNRYVAYHFLPFQATYYQLTCVDGPNSTLAGLFNRRKQDIADWYEACMPHSLMKFSFPSGTESGLYINRRGIMSRPDAKGVRIRGAKVATPEKMPNNIALNGVYYYIDDVIAYDKTTQFDVIGSERLRIDGTTLSPDFMTSGARGHYTTSTIENGKYGRGGQGKSAAGNCNHCLGFKGGFVTNFIYSDNLTHFHVRNRVLHFGSYDGDELTIIGKFDLIVKMPPVPEGEWEIRIFSCFGYDNRGIIQFYFGPGKLSDDGKKVIGNLQPCGIPLDMRPGGENPRVGWIKDSDLGDDDAIAAFDKSFRNRGWMKGMKAYSAATSESGGGVNPPFREGSGTLRKIITQFHSDGKSDYWLRCQQKLESTTNTMNFDALELCPSSVYNNEYYPEDVW